MNWGVQNEIKRVMPAVITSTLLASLCTIQNPSQAASASGQPSLGGRTNVAGCVNIACQLAPLLPDSARAMAADEIKNIEFTEEMTVFRVLLNAYYPQIQQKHIAVIDGND